MFWQLWIDALHRGLACDARREIAGLSDDDVASFWRWNDRETALHLRDCPDDERTELIAGLRGTLLSDVLAEISHRAGV